MFTSIVFSKDRPLQLDLCLKSINQNLFANNKIVVLYVTSEGYDTSYAQLINEHPEVEFFKQSYSIFEDIEIILNDSSEYVMFFTDDDIVYRKCELTEDDINSAFSNDACCVSLRLGINTTMRDYGDGVLRRDNIPEQIMRISNILVWNRTSIPVGGYWAYPLSVDGHIFQKQQMLTFCQELSHLSNYYENIQIPREAKAWQQTPNEFESRLQRFFFDISPIMASPQYSCVVNSPNNRVQDTVANRSGDVYNYTALDLKDEFDEGRRIILSDISIDDIACPHQEINILEGLS